VLTEDAERSTEASPGVRTLTDADAHHALRALEGPYLPWSSGAMRPRGLVTVCNDIVLGGRRRVVELGSGISTVLLSRLGRQLATTDDVRLVSVEHDERWAAWVSRQLRAEHATERATVVTAPLGPHRHADDHLRWYDEPTVLAGLDAAFGGEPIDLLIVDGPPAFDSGTGTARFPALPVLWALATRP
jgi:hypothetical protein